MKAILQNVKTGAITIDQIPAPIVRPGAVLVRNVCSLVSAGTEKSVLEFSKSNYLQKARQRPDLVRKVLQRAKNEGLWQTYQIVSNLIDQPIALGYSSAGVAIEVGRDVTDVVVGQHVACAGLFVATHSEVVAVPRNLLAPIPDGVPFDQASFVTLGAIAMQGVRLAALELGEQVVVYGLGLVGMVAAQLCAAAGCRVIGVDIDPAKIAKATSFGIDALAAGPDTESAILQMTGGFGADKALLCAATKSNDPIEAVPGLMRQKGVLVVVGDVGMNVPRRAYYDKEIDIRISRSYGPGRYDPSYEGAGIDYPFAYVRWTENRNMLSFLDLLARRRIDVGPLITHRFAIDEARRAYDIIEGTVREPHLGIVIRYAEDTVAAEAPAQPPPPPRASAARAGGETRVGLIGAGNFAKAFLLPALRAQPGVRLEAVCTASGVSAAAVAKKYDNARATNDAESIFADPSVNLIVIATRHDSHADYVVRAIEAGKAVYVEKPPAMTIEELDRIKAAYDRQVAQGGAPFLMVGYNRRFSPLAVTLRQIFAKRADPLAMVYRINAGAVAAAEWVQDTRVGGGRLVGECGHFVDLLTFVNGSEPVTVSGTAIGTPEDRKPDVLTMTLEFANGSLGTIHYFSNGHPSLPKEQVEVFGSGIAAQLLNFRTLRVSGARAEGKTRYFNQAKGFQEEARAVVDALRAGTGSPIPFGTLYNTSRATFEAERAMVAGTRIPL
jgi:predicted dehydrogenase/threonine dehydrogenase-like Zn-dependent dehydrogenase